MCVQTKMLAQSFFLMEKAACCLVDFGTAFLLYTMAVIALVLLLIFHYVPQCGHTHVLVYIAICSLMGSLSVMSVKALGIALKLTFQGQNQLIYPQTSVFAMVVVTCVLTQMNYLNKALDTFNTAVVSPIYYVMFTSLTILASAIMFKDWDQQSASQIITELCGFVTILSGTFLLHATKDIGDSSSTMGGLYGGLPITSMPNRLSMSAHVKRPEDTMENEEIPLRRTDSLRTP
jgi:lysylphosphatidylglycerol synthetase-like protein (DUF2156 family)